MDVVPPVGVVPVEVVVGRAVLVEVLPVFPEVVLDVVVPVGLVEVVAGGV